VIRRICVVTAVLLMLAPAPARADDPMRLGAQLTDRAGVLGNGRAEAEVALRELRDDTGLQLFVVFVGSFDGTGVGGRHGAAQRPRRPGRAARGGDR
jgi:uncharacterized membrane protein YgcG